MNKDFIESNYFFCKGQDELLDQLIDSGFDSFTDLSEVKKRIKKQDSQIRTELLDDLVSKPNLEYSFSGAEWKTDTTTWYNDLFRQATIPILVAAIGIVSYVLVNPTWYEDVKLFPREERLYVQHKQSQIPPAIASQKKAKVNLADAIKRVRNYFKSDDIYLIGELNDENKAKAKQS